MTQRFDANGVRSGDAPPEGDQLPAPAIDFEAGLFTIVVQTPAGRFGVAWPLHLIAAWGAQVTNEWMKLIAAQGLKPPVPARTDAPPTRILTPDFIPPRDLRRIP